MSDTAGERPGVESSPGTETASARAPEPSEREQGRDRRESGDLATRLLVAGFGIPVCVAVVWVGGLAFAAGLSLLAGVGMWEFVSIYRARASRTDGAMAVPFGIPGVAAAACLPLAAYVFGLAAVWGAVPVLLLAAGAWALATRAPSEQPVSGAALTVFGSVYLGGLLAFGVPLRMTPDVGRAHGTILFFLPVVVTWLTDTAAYFGGRLWGRRKLAPLVSPNKTIAGAVSAVIAGPLVAVGYSLLLAPLGGLHLDPTLTAVFGLAGAVAGIIGDLVESLAKRECGVKDASHILPGHGGILDRLDSLLWVLPVAYLFFVAS